MENELLEIEEITLLSVREAEALPKTVRDCGEWWWLRLLGNYDGAVVVDNQGYLSFDDLDFKRHYGVRPALTIPDLESLDLKKYRDSIEVFDREWIYIGNGMVLAEKPIFESSNYETSEIKQKLEDWLEKQL